MDYKISNYSEAFKHNTNYFSFELMLLLLRYTPRMLKASL